MHKKKRKTRDFEKKIVSEIRQKQPQHLSSEDFENGGGGLFFNTIPDGADLILYPVLK